jgi:hypothetical protein
VLSAARRLLHDQLSSVVCCVLRVACYISDKIFQLAPADRLTAAQIIDHDWFKGDDRPTSSQVT